MRDQIEAQLWAEHGSNFTADLHRLFCALKAVGERMVAIQYAAPWRPRKAPKIC